MDLSFHAQVFTTSELIAQIVVTGRSLESRLVAIVVPDEDVAMRQAWEENGSQGSPPTAAVMNAPPGAGFVELCKDPAFRSKLEAELKKLGKEVALVSR